jgi:hypothetical protein
MPVISANGMFALFTPIMADVPQGDFAKVGLIKLASSIQRLSTALEVVACKVGKEAATEIKHGLFALSIGLSTIGLGLCCYAFATLKACE